MTSRREFLSRCTMATAAAAFPWRTAFGQESPGESAEAARTPFTLAFAPHPNMFRASAGANVLDQIRFAHDQGFRAWEHNSMAQEDPALQEQIGQLLDQLDMQMGVFVAYANFTQPTFAVRRPEWRNEVLKNIREAVEVAKRCKATFMTVVPGSVDQQSADDEKWNRYGGPRLAEGFQTANVIELLRECAGILEPHKLVMVLEPLNWYANHGGTFLQRSDQAYALCKAVDSPSCKILFDIYHQQITEGNLIPNIDRCWDEIGYFQIGDNPGRKEPGTGEIHYANLLAHVQRRAVTDSRNFIFGMEHGNAGQGVAGERAVIEAYRAVDPAPA